MIDYNLMMMKKGSERTVCIDVTRVAGKIKAECYWKHDIGGPDLRVGGIDGTRKVGSGALRGHASEVSVALGVDDGGEEGGRRSEGRST